MMQRQHDLAGLVCQAMQQGDLEQVLALERRVYPHPWSLGNFTDSLASGYQCQMVRDADGKLLGYFLLMLGYEDAELLNVAVDGAMQGQGLGRWLLDQVVACARTHGMVSVLLEVRPSNVRALALYRRYGFEEINRRKAYYPAADGQREDAITMRLGVAA